MSQSEIFDALQFAADALELNGESAWEAALSAVEEMGAWDFEFWKAPRKPVTVRSLQEMYKKMYPQQLLVDVACNAHPLRIVADQDCPQDRAFFMTGTVHVSPATFAELRFDSEIK